MSETDDRMLLARAVWYQSGRGPRYLQLGRHLAAVIRDGGIGPDGQLPPERDLAQLAGVSRVTVRKAMAELAQAGLVVRRRGAGSFARFIDNSAAPRLEQSLSTLTSFTDYMRARGKTSTSRVLSRGLFAPTPDETMALGLAVGTLVARIERLRSADGTPMAIERSSLPPDILPQPESVETSLYAVLRRTDNAPTRAVQRISAINLGPDEAQLLNLSAGAAALRIDRTGYLRSGRPVEFTRGLYRSDIYDFVAELRQEPG
jgi:GntR family transcriptional regulator